MWLENGESTDKDDMTDKEKSVDLSDMLPLEGYEEVKDGTGLKLLTPNKLLTRHPILLAQIKAGDNSNEVRQILHLLYQHNETIKKVYDKLTSHGRKNDCNKRFQNFLI